MKTFQQFLQEEEIPKLLQDALHFNQQFLAQHHELKGHVSQEEARGFAGRVHDLGRSCLGAEVYHDGVRIGELGFDLALQPQGEHPLKAIMQHFYRDQRVDAAVGKGVMSKLLDEWLNGIKKLGVHEIMVMGGTKFWNKPAAKHPEFDWSGYDKA